MPGGAEQPVLGEADAAGKRCKPFHLGNAVVPVVVIGEVGTDADFEPETVIQEGPGWLR